MGSAHAHMPQERQENASSWMAVRRYSDESSALEAYEAARDALLIDNNLDASVIRGQLGGEHFVAVLGDAPLPEPQRQLLNAALPGDEAALPDFVRHALQQRRGQATDLGFGYLERRTAPAPNTERGAT